MKDENYSSEKVEQLITLYNSLGNDGLPKIAQTLGKSTKSVRAKLVHLGVYKSDEKLRKSQGPSKKEIITQVCEKIPDLDPNGLTGVTKIALQKLLQTLEKVGDTA